jgi:integrase
VRKRGHIRRRGEHSWEIKIDCGRDTDGNRIIHYYSVKGARADANKRLTELLKSQDDGAYVAPTKETVADFVRGRVTHWEASGHISPRSAERYRQLVEHQIVPHLGSRQLRDLRPRDIEAWHTTLCETLEPRTVGHAHRVLCKALKDAVTNEELLKNVASTKAVPKVTDEEMVIVKDVPGLVAKLPHTHSIYIPAMVALFTGMRLGEILALRWSRVDVEGKKLKVEEALQETHSGVTFKAPKSKAGIRTITLPDILVQCLREYRKEQLEIRLRLGLGKLDDALLFSNLYGDPIRTTVVSKRWMRCARAIGMPEITFHSLRHTHASALIDAGVDIVTISKRLGHKKPDVTLRVYSHLFRNDDSKAADAINAMLG